MEENNIIYTVKDVVEETSDVVTLHLAPSTDSPISYQAGQFITVFFPETGHKEGKSYSISSAPFEKYISITVKKVGVFSGLLHAKKTGDIITGSAPYGYFYSESNTTSMIFLAGGIGIAPLMSMIKQARTFSPERKIVLLYSNTLSNTIVFKNHIDALMGQSCGDMIVAYYVTQEVPGAFLKEGRIPMHDILEYSKLAPEQEFFVCGSIEFVRDYWRTLKSLGIGEEAIYTEAFF